MPSTPFMCEKESEGLNLYFGFQPTSGLLENRYRWLWDMIMIFLGFFYYCDANANWWDHIRCPAKKKHWSALSVYDYFVCDVFVPKCYYKQSCHPLHFSAPFLNEQVDSSSAICGWRVISLEYSYRNMQWSKRGRKRERKWQRDQGNFTRTDNLVGGILKMATTDSQPFSSVSFEEWN